MEIRKRVITIDASEINSLDDLGKIIAREIAKSIETDDDQKDLAHKAFKAWRETGDRHLADIREACGGKLPEGEHLMSLLFAGGFKEGYEAKSAECGKCD